jgi:hypothetical protein
MASLKPDIDIIRGDTSSIQFEFSEGGTPTDLTGATVYFTAKPALVNDVADSSAVIEVEVTSHTDPTAGKTLIPLTSTDTDVAAGVYFYDIQVKKANGDIISIPARKLEIFQDVTRRTT